MPILFVLADDWLSRRQLLAALDVKEEELIENKLTSSTVDEAEPPAADPEARRRQVEAFVASAGGDV